MSTEVRRRLSAVRHFVAQGGDPTGTGRGGDSLWGAPSPTSSIQVDALERRLHANDGRDRNKQQFMLLSRGHLDNKHTVFGRVGAGTTS